MNRFRLEEMNCRSEAKDGRSVGFEMQTRPGHVVYHNEYRCFFSFDLDSVAKTGGNALKYKNVGRAIVR